MYLLIDDRSITKIQTNYKITVQIFRQLLIFYNQFERTVDCFTHCIEFSLLRAAKTLDLKLRLRTHTCFAIKFQSIIVQK